MPSDGLQRMSLARAKRLALFGALVLWVVCPLVIGGWITLAVHQADRHTSAAMYALLIVWAVVDLVLLTAGFALLLGGIFFWWRSHGENRPAGANAAREGAARSAARQDILRQLREQLRDEGSATTDTRAGETTERDAESDTVLAGASVAPVDSPDARSSGVDEVDADSTVTTTAKAASVDSERPHAPR